MALNAEPEAGAAAVFPNAGAEPNPEGCPNAVLDAVLPNADGTAACDPNAEDCPNAGFPNAEGVEVLPNAGVLDPLPNADGVAVLPNAFAGFNPLFALPNADAPPPKALKPPVEDVEVDAFPNAEAPKPEVEPNAGLDAPNADGAPNAGVLLG